ncbi:variable surface protein Vir18 [Plasmodium vivax North Korean]|uniref:Variable surface protein Vir18 n=1 Tax=Plasmodium vivax North Korean TaxID=1035514 RepID=A0A0J9U2Z5_PLAVI|nr:variable surface protein Vir18 [Plasmodium vivax North Korean]
MGRIQIQNYDRKQILNEQECLNRYDELVKEIEPIIAEVNINDPDGFDKWEEVNKQIQEKEKELNPCREKGFLSIYLYGDEDIQVFNKKCTENPECPSSPLNPKNIPAPLKSKSLKGKNQNKNKYLHRPKWGQILTGAMLDLIIKHLMQWLVNLLINLERERINHKFNPPQLLPKMVLKVKPTDRGDADEQHNSDTVGVKAADHGERNSRCPTRSENVGYEAPAGETSCSEEQVNALASPPDGGTLLDIIMQFFSQTPQREYIMMGLAPVALILLLTFLFKYTPMKMLFRQKKSKNKKIGQKKCKGY